MTLSFRKIKGKKQYVEVETKFVFNEDKSLVIGKKPKGKVVPLDEEDTVICEEKGWAIVSDDEDSDTDTPEEEPVPEKEEQLEEKQSDEEPTHEEPVPEKEEQTEDLTTKKVHTPVHTPKEQNLQQKIHSSLILFFAEHEETKAKNHELTTELDETRLKLSKTEQELERLQSKFDAVKSLFS